MQSYESLLNGDLNWALLEGSMHFEGTSAVHRTLKRLASRFNHIGVEYANFDYDQRTSLLGIFADHSKIRVSPLNAGARDVLTDSNGSLRASQGRGFIIDL